MPKISYIYKDFRDASLSIIHNANRIIEEYLDKGFTLTLRQLYYQFVARDLISNRQSEYNKLGSIINDGRLTGLIDWDAIEDRTRNLQSSSHWDHPKDIIRSCIYQFKLDKWKGQDYRVEVWIEKDALLGVISSICRSLDVSYFSCRGYTSQSEMWSAGMRLINHTEEGQVPIILHLGDHDPSGIDMTRDINDRLQMFTGRKCVIQRLALNFDQIEEYQPPPNPAKVKDTRFKSYVIRFGTDCWELDALDPEMLQDLINSAVLKFRDENLYNETIKLEDEYKAKLRDISNSI